MKDFIMLVNKKSGISSYDVIRNYKKKYPKIKIGHAGTLDPFASGLLILLFGKACKLSDLFLNLDKEYEGIFKTGIITDTLDITGKIEKENNLILKNPNCLANYKYNQIPPKYSAKKINGKKAYELARKNISFELKKCPVSIYNFNVNKKSKDEFYFKAFVSKGCYIRSLVLDYAKLINKDLLATCKTLNRIKIGNFNLPKDELKLSLIDALNYFDFKKIEIQDENILTKIRHANEIKFKNINNNDLILTDKIGNFIAYYIKSRNNNYKPKIISEVN